MGKAQENSAKVVTTMGAKKRMERTNSHQRQGKRVLSTRTGGHCARCWKEIREERQRTKIQPIVLSIR